MIHLIVMFVMLVILAVPIAVQAAQCGPHDVVVKGLQQRYGEQRQSVMLDTAGAIVEIYASPVSGTWTALRTTPGGMACFVAAGTAYEEPEPTPLGDDL